MRITVRKKYGTTATKRVRTWHCSFNVVFRDEVNDHTIFLWPENGHLLAELYGEP